MGLEETIATVESCATIDDLLRTLTHVSENYGFASFNFLDTGTPHLDEPFYIGTLRDEFLNGYVDEKLVHVDPCVSAARRTNTPFTWGTVPVPQYRGVRKSGAQKTMEFAYDHGYTEGLIVPFHYCDTIGRLNSALIVFFWSDKAQKFRFIVSRKKHEMHLIMVYWAQRAVDIIGEQYRDGARFARVDAQTKDKHNLTDRERDVLAWAARGKTAQDTADILTLSEDTVHTHVRNALRKLNANNKTHGVAKAIYLGLIDT